MTSFVEFSHERCKPRTDPHPHAPIPQNPPQTTRPPPPPPQNHWKKSPHPGKTPPRAPSNIPRRTPGTSSPGPGPGGKEHLRGADRDQPPDRPRDLTGPSAARASALAPLPAASHATQTSSGPPVNGLTLWPPFVWCGVQRRCPAGCRKQKAALVVLAETQAFAVVIAARRSDHRQGSFPLDNEVIPVVASIKRTLSAWQLHWGCVRILSPSSRNVETQGRQPPLCSCACSLRSRE